MVKLGVILLVMIPFSAFGPGDAAEVEVVEQHLRGIADRDQRRAVEGVADAEALERTAQRIAEAEAEAGARLRIVLQVLQVSRGQVQILSGGMAYCRAWS